MAHSPRYAGRRADRARPTSQLPAAGRRRLRLTAVVAGITALVCALSGCFAVQLKATVHADNTVSGTSQFGISKSLAAVSGLSQSALLAQIRQRGGCAVAGASSSIVDYDDGTYFGLRCTFTGLSLAQFNSEAAGPTLTRNGSQFQLAGSINLLDAISRGLSSGAGGAGPTAGQASPTALPSSVPTDLASLLPTDLASLLASGVPTDLSSLLASGVPTDLSSLLPGGGALPSGLGGLDPTQLLKTAKISFQFTFPGKVTSSAGKISGHTVTFVADGDGTIHFATIAAATGGGAGSLNLTAWTGLGLLALLIVAVFATMLRRRRATPAGYPPASFGPAYPSQPPYPSQPLYPSQPPYPSQPLYPSQPPGQSSSDPARPGEPYTGPPQDPWRAPPP